jgi:hypothetical protein
MSESNYSRLVKEAIMFVRLGYADVFDNDYEFRSLTFLTDQLTTIEAQQVVRILEDYNAFAGVTVAKELSRFQGRIMYWQFGREGDPVLYVHLPYFTNQIEGQRSHIKGDPIDSKSHENLVREIQQTFLNTLEADHVTFDEDQHQVRIRWG